MSPSYSVPAQTIDVETVIKKSRFIAYLGQASTREEALAFIASLRKKYPDASHHCSAFVAGPPDAADSLGFDDDGEPGGTAGRPMLNVLQHKKIGEIVAVVVRYFGGVKLGAGGLVRAYSSAVQAACEQLPLTERITLKEGSLTCEYAREQMVRHYFDQFQVQILDCRYGEKVSITIAVSRELTSELTRQLSEASRGQVQLEWQE
ncbi:YigZ family protein [Endozoicomonas sp. Mp262]|uniref:YigZ family protein n=1 Tax=Endozoicomonas sp. Mp262 TaxID=2919499 RepID=UPI0021E0E1F2